MDDPDAGARAGGEPGLGGLFGEPGATRRSREIVTRVVDELLEAAPETASALGDRRFDDRLDDLSTEGMARRAEVLRDALQAVDGVDDVGLATPDRVDLDVLRGAVAADVWRLEELRAHEHDPRVHLPGRALRPLLDPAAGEPAARAQALTARLCAVPHRLAVARGQLRAMARVHVEAALEQAAGDLELLGAPVDALAAALAGRVPGAVQPLDAARAAAAGATREHVRWLESRLRDGGADGDADPRLGAERYAATLWYALDTETAPEILLTRAESDLQGVEEELADAAAAVAGAGWRAGQVREVLGSARPEAADTPGSWRQAVAEAESRVRAADLVSLPPGMPAVTAAACDEASRDVWPDGPVLLVAAHETAPGRTLQAAHAARLPVRAVRRAVASEVFVQGWAGYAEELLPVGDVLRLHRVYRRLLTTIAAVLDVRVHAEALPHDEAVTLLMARGHLDPAAAEAAWCRALLTPATASAPYAGHQELRDVVGRLRQARPGASPRALHDAVLAHGAPPPRHLRALLDLPDLP
jgi:uncharacterized protein (DUF885 family)